MTPVYCVSLCTFNKRYVDDVKCNLTKRTTKRSWYFWPVVFVWYCMLGALHRCASRFQHGSPWNGHFGLFSALFLSPPTLPVSLRAGSLAVVWVEYRGQGWQPQAGKAGEENRARKSEPARELLIFEFRPSRGVKSAFHMCQIR